MAGAIAVSTLPIDSTGISSSHKPKEMNAQHQLKLDQPSGPMEMSPSLSKGTQPLMETSPSLSKGAQPLMETGIGLFGYGGAVPNGVSVNGGSPIDPKVEISLFILYILVSKYNYCVAY